MQTHSLFSKMLFALCLVFGAFYLKNGGELLFWGLETSLFFAFLLPLISPKNGFPLFMLYLFALVLSQVPGKSFGPTLQYTVQSLICFRVLLISLVEIQNTKGGVRLETKFWICAILVEFGVSAIRLAATFKTLDPSLVYWTSTLSLRAFTLLSLPLFFVRLKSLYAKNPS